MAAWTLIIYICTIAIHSFLSFALCRAASTVVLYPPKATITPSIQANLTLYPLSTYFRRLHHARNVYSSILSTCQNHPNILWHMPHGIFPPHSAPRSSNYYSLLCDFSTSLSVWTATHPSYNIRILSYKLWSPFEWAPFSFDCLQPLFTLLIFDGGTCRSTGPTC